MIFDYQTEDYSVFIYKYDNKRTWVFHSTAPSRDFSNKILKRVWNRRTLP